MREETKLGLWIGIAFVVFVVVPVSCERGIKWATAEELVACGTGGVYADECTKETEWEFAIPEGDTVHFIEAPSFTAYEIEFARAEWCVGDEPCMPVLFSCDPGTRCVVALYDADGNERGAVVFDERGETE